MYISKDRVGHAASIKSRSIDQRISRKIALFKGEDESTELSPSLGAEHTGPTREKAARNE